MIDPSTAKITGLFDWKFSGVVPYCRWDPQSHFLSNLGIEDPVERKANIAELRQRFETLCRTRGAEYLLENAKYTSLKQESMQLARAFSFFRGFFQYWVLPNKVCWETTTRLGKKRATLID